MNYGDRMGDGHSNGPWNHFRREHESLPRLRIRVSDLVGATCPRVSHLLHFT
jgi:hypothetical protein